MRSAVLTVFVRFPLCEDRRTGQAFFEGNDIDWRGVFAEPARFDERPLPDRQATPYMLALLNVSTASAYRVFSNDTDGILLIPGVRRRIGQRLADVLLALLVLLRRNGRLESRPVATVAVAEPRRHR